MDKARQIAADFSRSLREGLSTVEMQEINRRNLENPENICASHDFCDANIPMDNAFMKVMGRSVSDRRGLEEEEDQGLWANAWDIAVEAGFDPVKIEKGEG